MRYLLFVLLLFVSVKADVPASDGFIIMVENQDSTRTWIRNTTTMEEFNYTALQLKLQGVNCDSIFALKWEIYWAGDSTDFLCAWDDPWWEDTYNTFRYYHPNDVPVCGSLDVYGTPVRATRGGGKSYFVGTMVFKADTDSTREYVGTAFTDTEINYLMFQMKADAVDTSAVLFWRFTLSFTNHFLEDSTPPYTSVDEDFYNITSLLRDDYADMILTDPF